MNRESRNVNLEPRTSHPSVGLSVLGLLLVVFCTSVVAQDRLQSDFLRLRSVGAVQFSPDGSKIAYSVTSNDLPGVPYSQLWLVDVATGQSTRVGEETSRGGQPVWSPDGHSIAYMGLTGGKSGLIVARGDGTSPAWMADVAGTNSSALTNTGSTIAWSADSKSIAYVHATAGPETKDAAGDPMVITRFLYKPTLTEGNTRFNDNRRLHIFLLDVATGRSRQLTDGVSDEHSLDWSPKGDEIVFVSNHELWKRSALRDVAQVKTPTMLIHGENDNDVPIAEAEQFYIALKDVGVETVMLRYPREGQRVLEPTHIVESTDRSIAWYEHHFPAPAP